MTFDQSYLDDESPMTEAERKEYCSAIAAVWPRLEKDIKKFLFKQIMFNNNQAIDWDQVLIGRGVFAGQEMLYDYWKSINQEYLDRLVHTNFDSHSPLAEF